MTALGTPSVSMPAPTRAAAPSLLRTPTLWAWRTNSRAERAAGVLLCAMLTAACAQISIPLPGTPVPITLQTFAVVLSGLVLGPALGLTSMGLYLLVGMVGLPVFAGADGGWHVATGATFGYLLGFLPASAAAGLLVQHAHTHGRSPFAAAVLAAIVANIVVFACGLAWLKVFMGTPWPATLDLGLWPHLAGTLVKTPMSIAGAIGLGAISRVR